MTIGPSSIPNFSTYRVSPAEIAPSAPVFVLTSARSGSTLLRFLLETHPELACPPETGVGLTCNNLAKVWRTLDGLEVRGTSGRSTNSDHAVAAIRTAIEGTFQHYLARCGKARWCDKSLDNVYTADLLSKLWPAAKFICLVRHPMDVIASAVEATPWGLTGFGFNQHAAKYPGNNVGAIADYWLERTALTLAFTARERERCYLLRYEDLVDDPDGAITRLLSFLSVSASPGLVERCFAAAHEANGAGDEKIWLSTSINRDSVGRGVCVPARAMPNGMREKINEILAKLGYRQIGPDWNDQPDQPDPRADIEPRQGREPIHQVTEPLASAIAGVSEQMLIEAASRWPHLAGRTVAIAVSAPSEAARRVSWRIGGGTAAPAAKPDVMITGDVTAWTSVLTGGVNMVIAWASGRLRVIGSPLRSALPEEAHAIAYLLGLMNQPRGLDSGKSNAEISPPQQDFVG